MDPIRSKGGLRRIVTLLVLLVVSPIVFGMEFCDDSSYKGHEDDGICPDLNTCCPLRDGSAGCIPNDLGACNGTCCDDQQTGCAVGYKCGASQQCLATESVSDPLVQVLPRYVLCHPKKATLSKVHGLKVDGLEYGELVYYSTHGDVQQKENDAWSHLTMTLVVVHGAGRNADDYFCSATAAVEVQNHVTNKESVLVVVPRFLVPSDGPVSLTSGGTPLRWNDEGSGPWRYGASAVYPDSATNMSSYHAMDQLIRELGNQTKFPRLRNITIAGHSSGGQFVQRWSLLTSRWYHGRRQEQSIHLRAVVANPSSYAYLTRYRYQHGAWRIPPDCPPYNQWEWGFDSGGDLKVPYKDEALQRMGGNLNRLAQRFARRQVLYLAGSLDRCNVSTPDGWCNSHGLETSCMDESQGLNRWERNHYYFESLQKVGVTTHVRLVVEGVGHDHSLMFTSPTGILALFGHDIITQNYNERVS